MVFWPNARGRKKEGRKGRKEGQTDSTDGAPFRSACQIDDVG